MSVPSELPDIGSTDQRLRQNPRFDPLAAGVGPEEYFVWTRFDGATTLRDLILMTGLGTPRAVEIVGRLRRLGAVLLPGEAPEQVAARSAPARAATAPAPGGPPPPSPEDAAAMAEDVDLDAAERARILAMHRRIRAGDAHAILGVDAGADRRALKRAYFALSKELHPDRYYGRRTGSFGPRLTEIFEAVAAAYGALTGGARVRRASSDPGAATGSADHAAELFERACQAEVDGDLDGALRMMASVLRLGTPPRYLRRAARVALAAGDETLALEYAKKAARLEPSSPSAARLLAQAFRAAGKLDDAEEVLVMALMIDHDNDQLAREMQADLAELRRRAVR
jgi:hypothetical protein